MPDRQPSLVPGPAVPLVMDRTLKRTTKRLGGCRDKPGMTSGWQGHCAVPSHTALRFPRVSPK